MKRSNGMVMRSMLAMTMAMSVVVAANPADAAVVHVTKAEQAVAKAEKLGTTLKWEISLEYRKAKYPNNLVGLPNMKLFDEAKRALTNARKAVAVLEGKDKVVLSARLDTNVATYINRTTAYIDAVTSGLKIQKKSKELSVLCEKGIVDGQIEKLYNELNAEIRKNSYLLDRVYGETTRSKFLTVYKQPALNLVNQLISPLKMKTELEKASASLEAGLAETAAQHLGNADFFLKEALKNGQKESGKLLTDLIEKQKAVQNDYNRYVASKNSGSENHEAAPSLNSFSVNMYVMKMIDPVKNEKGGFPYNLPGSYNAETNTCTISLANLDRENVFWSMELKTSNAEKFKITYVNSEKGEPNPRDMPLEYMVVDGSVKIKTSSLWFNSNILPYIDTLRDFSGKYMVIKGILIGPNNKEGKEITINITYK